MGVIKLRSLDDYVRYGAMMRIECPQCGRTAIFDPRQLIVYWRQQGWSLALETVGARFRCGGGPENRPGCGRRGVDIRAITVPERIAPVLPPPPIETDIPRGVDPAKWAVANERERKRLIRRARD